MTYDPPAPAEVLLVSCEDDYGDTVVPRLLAAGADLSRIHRVDGIKSKSGRPQPFSFAHYQQMREQLERQPNVRLVVIDPAGAYVGKAGVDDHKDSELRTLLDPMAELAAERRVTFIIVKHLNKGVTAKAVHKVAGSAGYVNAVRAAFIVTPDPAGEEGRRLLLPLKFNLGPKPQGLAYRPVTLTQEEQHRALKGYGDLPDDDLDHLARQLFRVEFLGPVDVNPDDAMSEPAKRERGPNKVEKCAEWLAGFLKDYAYPSEEIKAAAYKQRFTFDNVKEAKALLRADQGLRHSNKGRFQGTWWSGFGDPDTWQLRPESLPSPLAPASPETPHNEQPSLLNTGP
jgi:hypothetical protein